MHLSHSFITVPRDRRGFIRTRGTEEIGRLCAGCHNVVKQGLSSAGITG